MEIDLLERLRVAIYNMTKTANQILGGTSKDPVPSSADETDLLELQKVAMARSNIELSEKVLSRSATPISGPMPAPSALHTSPAAKLPQQQAAECDLSELQKVAIRGIKTELILPLNATGDPAGHSSAKEKATLQSKGNGNEFAPKSTPVIQQAGGYDLLELQKVARGSTPKLQSQQVAGGDDVFELQKATLKNVPNQGTPSRAPAAIVPTQPPGKDLLELQKLALRSVQKQTALASTPQQADRGPDFPRSVQSRITPTQTWQQGGGDLLELQKRALSSMSLGTQEGGIIVVSKENESKQQNNTQGGRSPTSSTTLLDKMPIKEALEMLSHELSTKEEALQSANRTIEDKDQLLLEYRGSLENTVNLLQSMNAQCMDVKAETAKVLIEAEEIYGNLRVACSAVENFDGLIPTCAKGIQFSEGPSNIFVADNTKFVFGLENGLGGKEVEIESIDEHRNLVEELLRELHNIDVARKEAQEGCELQIQRNEQLIAELQQLDIAPPSISEGATCGCGHDDQKPLEIASPQEDEVVSTGHSQPMSQTESPSDKAKESLCDHADKNPSDENKGNENVHIYEDPRDQASEMPCPHVYEIIHCQPDEDRGEKAQKKPCEHACESLLIQKLNKKTCDNVHESHPSDDKANEKSRDHVYESLSDHAVETPCDHVYEHLLDLANGQSSSHLYDKPGDPCNGNQCDRVDKNLQDQSKEIQHDHAYEDGKECGPVHEWENIGSSTFNAPTWMGQLPTSSTVPEVKASAELRSIESTRHYDSHKDVARTSRPNAVWDHLQHFVKTQHDQAIQNSSGPLCESPSDPTLEIPVDYAYEDGKDCGPLHEWENIGSATFNAPTWMGQLPRFSTVPDVKVSAELRSTQSGRRTSSPNGLWEHLQYFVKRNRDQAIQSSSGLSCDNTSDHTSEFPVDYANEDGKDCGPLHEWENVGSATFNAPTWMGQVPKSSTVAEVKASAGLRPMDSAHQYKSHQYVARTSRLNGPWDYLQHSVKRMQPQVCDDVEKIQLSKQPVKLQGDLDLKAQELQSHLDQKTREIRELNEQISQLQTALLQEQDNREKTLLQKTADSPHEQAKADLEHKDRVIHKMTFQMHQLEAALRQEREDMREALVQKADQLEAALYKEREEMRKLLAQRELEEKNINLTPSLKAETDNLQATLHARDEDVKDLRETIVRKEATWQAEKQHIMNCIDDLETKLLVKEEVIKLTYDLEISRAPIYSQPPPDEVKFHKGDNVKEGSHFFHKQGGNEKGREILDLRCEVFSLQDCLAIKTQTIKTMEKELARSYNIVTGLRSKVRALQECERISQRQGQNKELTERLRDTEEKLKTCLGERAVMSNKIQDLSKRCKYLEDLEHLHRESSDDMKTQAIKELELERNVQIIKSLHAHCNEYEARAKQAEARNMLESASRSSDSGTSDSWKQVHTKLAQLSDEKNSWAAECEQLQSQLKRKDQVIIQLQGDVHNLKRNQNSRSPKQYQQNELTVFSDDGKLKASRETDTQSTKSVPEHGKVEPPEVSTLRELLREQWKLQKVMEDRLNTMMAYVSDRVDEFEMSLSDATSDASFPPPCTDLNHFHVEAKLMKLQLEQQLQVLRGQVIASLPDSGVASPGQPCPQTCLSTQNKQLLSEKNALEDSAQTLQHKTSRLLNRLTFMRAEYGPSSR